MASRMYNRGMFEIINQTTNWDTGDIRLLLLLSSYSFNPDSNFVSDISASELSTTGYSRYTFTATTITEDDANDRVVMDAEDVVYAALGPASGGPTVGGSACFRQVGADTTNPLIVFNDFTDTTVNGGSFTIQWDTAGVITATSP